MLKFENVAEIGDTIKAFDFMPMEGRDDMYIIGEVVDKGVIIHPVHGVPMMDGYTIRITGASREDDSRIGDEGYVPFENFMLEYENRVQLIK